MVTSTLSKRLATNFAFGIGLFEFFRGLHFLQPYRTIEFDKAFVLHICLSMILIVLPIMFAYGKMWTRLPLMLALLGVALLEFWLLWATEYDKILAYGGWHFGLALLLSLAIPISAVVALGILITQKPEQTA